MRESVVSAKPLLLYGLARNQRGPKRPSEPRPSGVHPEEDAVERRCEATSVLRCCPAAVSRKSANGFDELEDFDV